MDNAVKYKLTSFEGPLDLLLQLISLNKVDISDIPIALILEQYMEVLADMLEHDLQNACDFVAMAARLVYIKTQMLLPKPQKEDEEDPRASLARSLIEYQKVRDAAPFISRRVQAGRDAFLRTSETLPKLTAEFYVHTSGDLVRAAKNLLERASRRMPPVPAQFEKIVGAEPVPIEEKMTAILDELDRHGSVVMDMLYSTVKSRSELVATFLALLELISTHRAALDDSGDEVRIYESSEVQIG